MATFKVPEPVMETAGFINLTSSGIALNSPGRMLGIFVAAASATPTIKVWDNTAASGTVIAGTFTPTAGTFYKIPANARNGVYVSISGTVDCTVFGDPI